MGSVRHGPAWLSPMASGSSLRLSRRWPPGGQTTAIVAKRPGWADIPAVRNHNIFGLNDDIASRWGPRLPSLVIAISNALAKATS